jgi:hypothetical protein
MQVKHRALIKLVFYLFQLILVLHIIGCFWFVISSGDTEWIPTNNFIDSCCSEILYSFNWEKNDLVYAYLQMFNFAVLSFTQNELGPRTLIELRVSYAYLLMLLIFNSVFFGQIVTIIAEYL